jgi:hypothetical protein
VNYRVFETTKCSDCETLFPRPLGSGTRASVIPENRSQSTDSRPPVASNPKIRIQPACNQALKTSLRSQRIATGGNFFRHKSVTPAYLSPQNCPFSSGRGDLNPGPLGPKNCCIPPKRRFQSSFPNLNYMKCIEFHKPGTIWAHSLEDQSRTYLHAARFAGRSPRGVVRFFLASSRQYG